MPTDLAKTNLGKCIGCTKTAGPGAPQGDCPSGMVCKDTGECKKCTVESGTTLGCTELNPDCRTDESACECGVDSGTVCTIATSSRCAAPDCKCGLDAVCADTTVPKCLTLSGTGGSTAQAQPAIGASDPMTSCQASIIMLIL